MYYLTWVYTEGPALALVCILLVLILCFCIFHIFLYNTLSLQNDTIDWVIDRKPVTILHFASSPTFKKQLKHLCLTLCILLTIVWCFILDVLFWYRFYFVTSLHCALVYCNRSRLWVCLQRAGGRAVSEPYYSQRARSVCVSLSALSFNVVKRRRPVFLVVGAIEILLW